jgi:hypothetical protein
MGTRSRNSSNSEDLNSEMVNTNAPQSETQETNPVVEDIKKNAEKYRFESFETKPLDTMSTELVQRVINDYSRNFNISPELTVAGMTRIIQEGGTNQSKKTLTVVVGNQEFSLERLRNLINSIDKSATVRKFAKGAREIIIQVALINKWPGPLTKELLRIDPNLQITPENAPWCLEVHSDNYNCPPQIRDALVRREEQLKLALRSREINRSTKNTKPRKNRGKKKQ